MKCFLRFIEDLQYSGFNSVIGLGRTNLGVFVYDENERDVTVLDDSTLPWPVSLILSGYKRKHIFAGVREPSLKQIGVALVDWCNRI